MLRANQKKEEERVERVANSSGIALVAVSLTVSPDELAIGFALGLTRVPVVAAVVPIAGQALADLQRRLKGS
jgi:hypothetical protein